jgi:hypothetical protein
MNKLPAGYAYFTGSDGTISVADLNNPGYFYSLAAWKQIEQGNGLWKEAHDAIFGRHKPRL